nr:spore maturation protein [bacterium]
MQKIAAILPALVMVMLAALPLFKGVAGYSLFLEGALSGAKAAVRALPAIIAMLCCMRIWAATGLGGAVTQLLGHVLGALGIPEPVLAMIAVRPFSGGGALGVLGGILTASGADSMAGRMASAIMGCTETYFYTATVYYGASGRKMGRGMLARAAITQLSACVVAMLLCRLFFGA